MSYRVLQHTGVTRAGFALAPRFADIAEAFAAMRDGIVVADDGRVVAFHERHAWLIGRGHGLWQV